MCLRKNTKIIKLLILSFFYSISIINSYEILPTDSRIKTIVYNPNEIFQLKFVTNYQAILELNTDESIEFISLGNPDPWNITRVDKKLLIQPLEAGVKTNMTISTEKRMYLFEISSTENSLDEFDENVVFVAKFYYPSIEIDNPEDIYNDSINFGTEYRTMEEQEKLIDSKIENRQQEYGGNKSNYFIANMGNFKYNYSYSGYGPMIKPDEVFSNGKQTFFYFKKKSKLLPDIYSVSKAGMETRLSVGIVDKYVYVNSNASQFAIRHNDELICIFKENESNGKV